jgi:transcriptional regulator with XRE-family HTH domain
MLGELLDERMKSMGISQREAGRQMGLSGTTIAAIIKNRPLEVHTAYIVCKWLGVPIEAAIGDLPTEEREWSQIVALLKTAPELADILRVAATEVVSGVLTPADFKDILEYAAYKIQKRKDKFNGEQRENSVGNGQNH